jgi:hypothetical protein
VGFILTPDPSAKERGEIQKGELILIMANLINKG